MISLIQRAIINNWTACTTFQLRVRSIGERLVLRNWGGTTAPLTVDMPLLLPLFKFCLQYKYGSMAVWAQKSHLHFNEWILSLTFQAKDILLSSTNFHHRFLIFLTFRCFLHSVHPVSCDLWHPFVCSGDSIGTIHQSGGNHVLDEGVSLVRR